MTFINYCLNSNFIVLSNPSDKVYGALKPEDRAFVASNCVVAQNFFTRMDETEYFFFVKNPTIWEPE